LQPQYARPVSFFCLSKKSKTSLEMSAHCLWIHSSQTVHCTAASFLVNFFEHPKQLLSFPILLRYAPQVAPCCTVGRRWLPLLFIAAGGSTLAAGGPCIICAPQVASPAQKCHRWLSTGRRWLSDILSTVYPASLPQVARYRYRCRRWPLLVLLADADGPRPRWLLPGSCN
jgi:hypothetical protein